MKLANLFQSGMIFQRRIPFRIFGEGEGEDVEVRLNGTLLGKYHLGEGRFSLTLPPQEAMENAVLQVGGVTLERVDFGEVWLAGGQSNMEFFVRWDAERELIYSLPPDDHLRYYDAGRWAFEGEKEDGLRPREAEHWDRWESFSRETSPYFSALATFFAIGLREKIGVPVGIVGCNNGATTASSWVPEEDLTGPLSVYREEYARAVEGIDMKRYNILNYLIRADACDEATDLCLSGAPTPEEVAKVRLEHKSPQWLALMKRVREEFTPAEFAQVGPHSRNCPGAMWRNMVLPIAGFAFRGTLWYQGCSDQRKWSIYEVLLTKLIRRWRETFCDMPFLVVQLAPFLGNAGQGYGFSEIRAAQEETAKHVKDVWLVSSSDVGNKLDIHPKYKRKLGERCLLQALDKVYGIPALSDAPAFCRAERQEGGVRLFFTHAEGLTDDGDFSAMEVKCGGTAVKFSAKREGETVFVSLPAAEGRTEIEFAKTPYYNVTLKNAAGIPALPFRVTLERDEKEKSA